MKFRERDSTEISISFEATTCLFSLAAGACEVVWGSVVVRVVSGVGPECIGCVISFCIGCSGTKGMSSNRSSFSGASSASMTGFE